MGRNSDAKKGVKLIAIGIGEPKKARAFAESYRSHWIASMHIPKERNMVLGKRCIATPSDSLAIITANAVEPIPYFSSVLKGVSRSNNNEITMSAVREWATSHGSKLSELKRLSTGVEEKEIRTTLRLERSLLTSLACVECAPACDPGLYILAS
ncbi:hypothetical protein Tco_0913427 [Tanacetum coccineum]